MLTIVLEGKMIETKAVGYQISDIRNALLEVAESFDDWKAEKQS
jgi:hypothetical protein